MKPPDPTTSMLGTPPGTEAREQADAEIPGPERDLEDPSLYFNRELSWLDFNDRVLQLAEDPSTPLLERVKFAAIYQDNLDEFFMVRVAEPPRAGRGRARRGRRRRAQPRSSRSTRSASASSGCARGSSTAWSASCAPPSPSTASA